MTTHLGHCQSTKATESHSQPYSTEPAVLLYQHSHSETEFTEFTTVQAISQNVRLLGVCTNFVIVVVVAPEMPDINQKGAGINLGKRARHSHIRGHTIRESDAA